MRVIRCDMLSCSKELEPELVAVVRILDKIYDFCPDCLASLETFIKHRLGPGTNDKDSLAAFLEKMSNVEGVMLPKFDYPVETVSGPFGSASGGTGAISSVKGTNVYGSSKK